MISTNLLTFQSYNFGYFSKNEAILAKIEARFARFIKTKVFLKILPG